MMTDSQAEDEINAAFLAKWNAGAAAIVGYVPEIRWFGVQKPELPAGDKYWCQVIQVIARSGDAAFMDDSLYEGGKRMYETYGVVLVEIFAPQSDAQASKKGKLLGQLARDAYRGHKTPGCVWFFNATSRPSAPVDRWQRVDMTADFRYNTFG